MRKRFAMTRVLRTILVCCGLALGFTGISAGGANAKQCIWNKGGFVLKARWYNREDINVVRNRDGTYSIIMKQYAKPIQQDQWPIAQGCCTRGAHAHRSLRVILSIAGAEAWNTEGAKIDSRILGPSAINNAILRKNPDVYLPAGWTSFTDTTAIFYVGDPSTASYLDVWGTIWKPATGPGGPIN